MTAKYLVGIDLGTTNTAMAHVDLAAPAAIVDDPVLQLVAPGESGKRPTLPSLTYLYGGHELAANQVVLPWQDAQQIAPGARIIGELARQQGALVPGRLVASAKSWLCHPRVDRLASILPWGEAIVGLPKVSPVDASAEYLRHLAASWRHTMGCELAEQEVVLCVPASFDEVARELSLRAATQVGLAPTLLEEPQAAFYAWLAANREQHTLAPGDTILVFDVGGGTTDFSLITVKEDGGYERTAVGDHLLLGGDNMDLALARRVEGRVGGKLDAHGFQQLVQACRQAKEKLLSDTPKDAWTVHVAGRGLRLIGGAVKDELQRGEVEELILDGFFPKVGLDARPQLRGGLQEFGLPYAADAAITKHAAAFLRAHHAKPTAVLWNGGVLRSPKIRDRIVEVLESWTGERIKVLDNYSPDLAVARGAAYYGLARRGQGLRIAGGAARAYYIGLDTTAVEPGRQTVMCLVPRGFEEGASVDLREHELEIVTNRPVRLRLFSSSERSGDQAGAVFTVKDGELAELPPLYTVLRYQRAGQDTALAIHLLAHLTALGTLELDCVARATGNDADRWRLSFDLRGGTAPEAQSPAPPPVEIDDAALRSAIALVRDVFGKSEKSTEPASVMKQLQALLGPKDQWPMPVLRALWEPLFELRGGRGKSAQHEARWLNLLGYVLRPGFGYPLDDWRVRETWRLFNAGLVFDKDDPARLEWWILWRRVSGGLSRTQQDELWKRIGPYFAPSFARRADRKSVGAQETAEMWRTIASMERIPHKHKGELGDVLVNDLDKKGKGLDQMLWVLGRLGGRVPLYGPIEEVVPPKRAGRWVEKLLALEVGSDAWALCVAEIARASGDRARDLDEATRRRIAARLRETGDGERLARLVLEPTLRHAREERLAFGDSLPSGIRLAAAPTPSE